VSRTVSADAQHQAEGWVGLLPKVLKTAASAAKKVGVRWVGEERYLSGKSARGKWIETARCVDQNEERCRSDVGSSTGSG